MVKDEVLKELESAQDRMKDNGAIELPDMLAITDALIYIVGMLEAAVKKPKKPKAEPEEKKNRVDMER